MMESSSNESSESEAESFSRKKNSPPNNKAGKRIEVKSSHGHGIVDVSSPRKRKSSVKQSSVSPKNLSKKTNEVGELNNLNIENRVNIKHEKFLSDAENEDSITRPHSADRAKKSLFDGWDPKTGVVSNPKENTNEFDNDSDADEHSETINKYGNSPSQDRGKKLSNRYESIIKEELILPNDSEEDSEEFDETNRRSEREISPEFEGSDKSSDSNIEPSQFYSSQWEDIKNDADEKKPVQISKELLPVEDSDAEKSDDETKKILSHDPDFRDIKPSRNKSPLKNIKTEIIGKSYERNDQRTVKSRNEFSSDEDRPVDETDDPSNEKMLRTNDRFEEGYPSVDKGISKTKCSPGKQKKSTKELQSSSDESQMNHSSGKKRQDSPKKRQSPVKTKQISKAEVPGEDRGVEAGERANKKAALKRTLKSLLNDGPAMTKRGIQNKDDDSATSEEEEKHVRREEVSKNFLLGLEKPKDRRKNSFNSNGGQMVLVKEKSNDELLDDNPSIESSSIPLKSSRISDDKNTGSSSEDDSGDAAPSFSTGKLVEKKSKDINGSSDKTELAMRAEERSKSRSASASLTKVSDSEDNLRREKTDNGKKTPLKRKHSESSFETEEESNKRAKLLSQPKNNAHAVSDSDDDTDSLTKLNTTLNKSMALMDNDMETTRSNKSRKSVSISMKHKSKTISAQKNARAQKSILKKKEYVAAVDKEENQSPAEEEKNIQENVRSVEIKSKIIERPLNFRDLEQQNSQLTHDAITKASFVLQDLSSDDEIYIMDVPRTIDPEELKGQTIRLTGKNKLKIGQQLYETCEKNAPNISCIFKTARDRLSYETVNIKPVGCINVRQKLLKSLNVELPPVEKVTVPFPKNLKSRHPLFGANYEDKIIVKEIKVSKNIVKSIPKSNETRNDVAEKFVEIKVEKTLSKKRKFKKAEDEETDSSLQPDETLNNSKTDVEKTVQSFSNYSSDSDSYEGFFQTVKRGKMKKHKKTKEEQNLSTISNIERSSSMRDMLVHSKYAMEVSQQEELSVIKESESSFNAPAIKLKNLKKSSKNSKFSSSTPNKVIENQINDEGEAYSNNFGKRKKDKKKREIKL